MKRRNVEVGKMRRPMKRSKIPEGLYGSTLLYFKFFILWALVILADFILEFRFEFLWPFYLLLRSVYDSFKYQGLAFSVFFVCVALTSDMLCFFFIPVHWLFFAASTYVWVQYVWHTDKGICGPTIVLWMLFVYIEAAVRLRDVKHMPGHMDLCRPFAAHCIGYPVVTLGFGFKSYVGFRMRQKKQRDVAKENDFYLQLMQQALPTEAVQTEMQQQQTQQQQSAVVVSVNASHANANNANAGSKHGHNKMHNGHVPNGVHSNGVQHHQSNGKSHRKSMDKAKDSNAHVHVHDDHQTTPTSNGTTQKQKSENHRHGNNHKMGNGVIGATIEEVVPHTHDAPEVSAKPVNNRNRRDRKEQTDKDNREQQEQLQRLEQESKRLRSDLQSSRASEQELRLQVVSLTTTEKVSRGEILAMQRELEDLQSKLHSHNTSKSQDKQLINNLERRLAEERRARTSAETQLNQERKSRKLDEQRAAQAAAQALSIRSGECTDMCRQRRRDLENEITNLRSTQNWIEKEVQLKDREHSVLTDKLRETEMVVSALNAMQEKTQHLENSLSAETRIKLDLFSALGEVKRQLEIKDSCLRAREKEIEELKGKIAQVLAVMPDTYVGNPTPTNMMSRVRLTATGVVTTTADNSPGSTLDPNATAYTPKGSLAAEA